MVSSANVEKLIAYLEQFVGLIIAGDHVESGVCSGLAEKSVV